ncbi:uncharacterized protein Triagg1_3774 [Trichoderma aggressivum f. europaeum]|uniref:Zn(2)-C6 fungal-type domain-containing protein n=1 Tax=Trichoderma aggressivum f. europaeum TaxID=173218 RepID=A0AAE1M0Z1_9HYPO|nr:hypothetical protein Triagg1_3774 [Trichoderma aggressivum f. europaeum]
MAHAPEHEPHKRKRDLGDDGSYPAHHRQAGFHEPGRMQASPSLASMAPESIVNFVTRPDAPLLSFLPGDVDTFNDIIYLMGEYEGVLDRKESMAANLGAKLTGPRFLRGLERFFEGPIKIISANIYHQITWLEIVTFAKTNPEAFTVIPQPNGSRCCRFVYNGVQAEIIEDDWRLISSGALDRFPLEHTFEEDEAAELATLEILERRASYLHRKADELAARARVLHQRLELRTRDVARRQQFLEVGPSSSSASGSGSSSGSSSSFQAINQPPRPVITNPNGQPYDIHSDLLHQFTIAAMQNSPPQGPPPGYQAQPGSPNGAPVAGHQGHQGHQGPLAPPALEAPPYHPPPANVYPTMETAAPAPVPAPAPVAAPAQASASNSRSIATIALSQVVLPGDPASEVHRPLVLQKTDTLNKGDIIFPPCDRCRRLRLQCVKHLTACRGCTKKHARCNWRNVTDDEAAAVKEELTVIYNEAQKAATTTAAAASAKRSGKAPASAPPQPEAGSSSRPASGSGAGNMDQVHHWPVPGPSAGPAPMMAPPLAPAPVAELPRRLLPTTRLTRIEPAPTVPRNPPRTGQLAAILSPPDYEPRPFGSLPPLAPR